MDRLLGPVIAGIVCSLILITLFSLLFAPPTNFDYSKVVVRADEDNLTGPAIRKAVDAILSNPTGRAFVSDFDNPSMRVQVGYMSAEEIDQYKYPGGKERSDDYLSFVPDGLPVVVVAFDSVGVGISIPEHPRVQFYLNPDSYRIYGLIKSDYY